MKTEGTLYSLTAAALLLGVTRERAEELAREADIGHTRFGIRNALLFSPADIEALRGRLGGVRRAFSVACYLSWPS